MNIDNSLTNNEVIRRFPEVTNIKSSDVRGSTIDAINDLCPDYFWEVPGSSSGKYHPEDHREERGLWLHTKRAATQFERLSPSYVSQGKITKHEQDCGRAAILLHDIYKYGWPKQEHTTKNHDVVAAEILEEHADVPGEVIGCVETHNGPWYAGPSPRNDLEQVHHLADMAASDVNNPNIAILEPCRELEKQFPNVNKLNE